MMPDAAISSSSQSGSGGGTLTLGIPPLGYSSIQEEPIVARDSLLMVKLRPMKPKAVHDFRLFTLTPASGGAAPRKMKIYFSPTNIQDTFSNQITDNFLSQMLRASNKLGQVAQMFGYDGKDISNGASKIANSMLPDFITKSSLGAASKKLMNTAAQYIAGERFEFPKVWEDSQADITKEIQFKLYCTNPDDDGEYMKAIVHPLEEILKYVLPVQTEDAHYKWPYFCKAEAPGLFEVPEGIITSIVVNKGEGINFGSNNRPNIVDVTLTISAIKTVMTNDKEVTAVSKFSLSHYINNLSQKKTVGETVSGSVPSPVGDVKTSTPKIPPTNVSNEQRDSYNRLKDYSQPDIAVV